MVQKKKGKTKNQIEISVGDYYSNHLWPRPKKQQVRFTKTVWLDYITSDRRWQQTGLNPFSKNISPHKELGV